MTTPRLARAAVVCLALAIIVLAIADIYLALTRPTTVPSADGTLASSLAPVPPVVFTAAIAMLLAWRRPTNPAGWLLATFALLQIVSAFGADYALARIYGQALPQAPTVPLGLLAAGGGGASFSALAVLLLVFPDGRLLSRGWRIVLWLDALLGSASFVAPMLDPAAIGDSHHRIANPIGIAAGHDIARAINSTVGVAATFALVVLGLLAMVVRYRLSGLEVRQQVKWVGAGAFVMVFCVVVGLVTSPTDQWTTPVPIAAEIVGFSAVPICIGVALLKYRLYDIDLVVNRALVYGALAAFITAIYVAIVVGFGTLINSGGRPNLALSILATGVVAVAFQPARERLQRVANRLVYGKRATPYEVLSEFSGRVAETYVAGDLLPRMARVLAEGTGAEVATVWLRAGDQLHPRATFPEGRDGQPPVDMTGQLMPDLPGAGRAAPVRHQGELLGALTITKRGGEALTPIEEGLLDDLANQAGLVLKNVRLSADLEARLEDLEASRRRMVRAQDEERRRLERNLHDGPQQNLAALKEKLADVRVIALQEPGRAKAILQELKAQAGDTLEALRDLARGIYPPLLADQGLSAALQAQARKVPLPVTVDADGLGRYPQEIESAVYFCCLEALQNVVRHASAASVTVRLRQEGGELHFEVADDGVGFDRATVARGAGLIDMADRLDALGGRLDLRSEPGQGTVLTGLLPVVAMAGSAPTAR